VQANDSLDNVGALLESDSIDRYYPEHAQRRLSKYGHSKGWNSSRLATAGGFTIDSLGLDTAARGLKVGEVRPDLIILDDIDGLHDSAETTRKKFDTITKTLLPAGTARTAVLAIQNLIIPHGVFAKLADGRADMLARRRMSGPHPAIVDLETSTVEEGGRLRAVITGGRATWEGQSLEACQTLIDLIGLKSFLQECQHNVTHREGALWQPELFRHVSSPTTFRRIAIAVDPSGGGDEIGIIAAGVTHDRRYRVLADVTQKGRLGPLNWGAKAVELYDELEADRIVAERNFGGDMVESNIRVAAGERRVPVEMVTASRGKAIRAEPVASLYEDGLVDHVPGLTALETELTTWIPGDKWSPNRLDALVWVLTELALKPKKRVDVYYAGMDADKKREESWQGKGNGKAGTEPFSSSPNGSQNGSGRAGS